MLRFVSCLGERSSVAAPGGIAAYIPLDRIVCLTCDYTDRSISHWWLGVACGANRKRVLQRSHRGKEEKSHPSP